MLVVLLCHSMDIIYMCNMLRMYIISGHSIVCKLCKKWEIDREGEGERERGREGEREREREREREGERGLIYS